MTNPSISRRTVLKGLGTAIALPWLEGMMPAVSLAGAYLGGQWVGSKTGSFAEFIHGILATLFATEPEKSDAAPRSLILAMPVVMLGIASAHKIRATVTTTNISAIEKPFWLIPLLIFIITHHSRNHRFVQETHGPTPSS